jgi:hypothetical protein
MQGTMGIARSRDVSGTSWNRGKGDDELRACAGGIQRQAGVVMDNLQIQHPQPRPDHGELIPEEIAQFAKALTRLNKDIERRQRRPWPRPQT